jgi:hypothetical protein
MSLIGGTWSGFFVGAWLAWLGAARGWGCLPCVAARRVPPRQAGNFLLLAQQKVTKEEGLNTHLTAHLRGRALLIPAR